MSRSGVEVRPWWLALSADPVQSGLASVHRGLSLPKALGQGRGESGLDGRFGVDQPLKVLAGQFQQPTGFCAPDGGETGVAVAASPVAGGELAEVVTGPQGADEPGVDEGVVAAGQDDV